MFGPFSLTMSLLFCCLTLFSVSREDLPKDKEIYPYYKSSTGFKLPVPVSRNYCIFRNKYKSVGFLIRNFVIIRHRSWSNSFAIHIWHYAKSHFSHRINKNRMLFYSALNSRMRTFITYARYFFFLLYKKYFVYL